MILAQMGPFDQKPKSIFSQIRKLRWAVPGQNSENGQTDGRYFIASWTCGSWKTMKLSKSITIFPLNKSQHKLTLFSHHYRRRTTKIEYLSLVKFTPRMSQTGQNSTEKHHPNKINLPVKQSQRTIRTKTTQLTHSGILLAARKKFW